MVTIGEQEEARVRAISNLTNVGKGFGEMTDQMGEESIQDPAGFDAQVSSFIANKKANEIQ